MEKSKIAILGLGNILMQDEGIGVHVVNNLKQSYIFDPAIEIIDGGTLGADLLPYFENNDKIIIVDAVNFDKEPGYIGVIEKEDILTRLNRKLSLHHFGLTDLLSSIKILDIEPSEICLIGIQPACMETGLELSVAMAKTIRRATDVIISKLMEWHVTSNLRDGDFRNPVRILNPDRVE